MRCSSVWFIVPSAYVTVHITMFCLFIICLQFLFTQSPSPSEDPAPSPPSKEKDSNGSKKLPGKRKPAAAAAVQQVEK